MKIAANPCRVCTMTLALLREGNAMVTLMVRFFAADAGVLQKA
jgi:hypothetical protein